MSSVAALPFSAWPTGRKVAASVFAVGGYIALACVAVYLAGVLFLVLNKANPKQAQFASIVHYWGLYADDAQLRKRLQLAIGVSGIGLLILLPAGLVAAARPRRALHGDARFASPAEIDRAGLTGGDGQPGIIIGRHRGKFLSLPGQLSVMLSAPTRSGKGVGVVIPTVVLGQGLDFDEVVAEVQVGPAVGVAHGVVERHVQAAQFQQTVEACAGDVGGLPADFGDKFGA